ncbi:MAG: aminotransferase class V-fold PLP-dependent enzyme [Balneolaceae bacterium]|nr:aminotransferase class V-fold PLP-dependent enzyme [Balneolaceae bacterium]
MNSQKHLFSLDPDVTYLNCAYMSPLMKSVEEAGIQGIRSKLQPNHVSGEDFFRNNEKLRQEYGRLINCSDVNRLVVVPSVSYGMANVANNLSLSKGDEILIIDEQFPSNVYPWMRIAEASGAQIKTVSAPESLNQRGLTWNQRVLEAINPKTRLVACGHIHWADGTLFDLVSIRKRTNEVGALLVIDGTQSIGALPFDVAEIQPDALIAAGYKSMMGPYSIGMAYYGEAFDNGIPIEENWINRFESKDFANLVNYNDRYQPGALRYEVGERSNFILVPMLLEAIKTLNEWQPRNVQEYCQSITTDAVQELIEHGYWVEDELHRASNLFGIRLPDHITMEAVKRKLDTAGIFVSYRGDCIRVSPNVYNQTSDLLELANALTEIA